MSIYVNGVRDVHFVFHRVFFSHVNVKDFEQHTVIKFLSKRNKTNVEIENELFEVWGYAAYKKSTFGMKHVCVKLVPRILTPSQKAECVAVASELL